MFLQRNLIPKLWILLLLTLNLLWRMELLSNLLLLIIFLLPILLSLVILLLLLNPYLKNFLNMSKNKADKIMKIIGIVLDFLVTVFNFGKNHKR